MTRVFSLSLVFAVSLSAWYGCSSADPPTSADPRTEATQLAADPIPCSEDSDCCVVNDDCLATAYVVASKDAGNVASLIASADNSRCTACITPTIQVSCGPSGTCVAQKIDLLCDSTTFRYPGDHCGKLGVPASCLDTTPAEDAGFASAQSGARKPLSVFPCGG